MSLFCLWWEFDDALNQAQHTSRILTSLIAPSTLLFRQPRSPASGIIGSSSQQVSDVSMNCLLLREHWLWNWFAVFFMQFCNESNIKSQTDKFRICVHTVKIGICIKIKEGKIYQQESSITPSGPACSQAVLVAVLPVFLKKLSWTNSWKPISLGICMDQKHKTQERRTLQWVNLYLYFTHWW